MKDLTRCKQFGGKTFCWDKEDRRVVEVRITPLDFAVCPADVLRAFIEDGEPQRCQEDALGYAGSACGPLSKEEADRLLEAINAKDHKVSGLRRID